MSASMQLEPIGLENARPRTAGFTTTLPDVRLARRFLSYEKQKQNKITKINKGGGTMPRY